MNRREIENLTRVGRLMDRTAILKPTAPYQIGGGYIIACRDNTEILLAIRGRLDDRVWVSPAQIASISDTNDWEIDGSRLTSAAAEALRFDVAPQDGRLWVSRVIDDNLRRLNRKANSSR